MLKHLVGPFVRNNQTSMDFSDFCAKLYKKKILKSSNFVLEMNTYYHIIVYLMIRVTIHRIIYNVVLL